MTTHEKHDEKHKPPQPHLCHCSVPPHIDNCPDCFGFGMIRVTEEKHIRYRARRASEAFAAGATMAAPCPTCQTCVTIEGYGEEKLAAAT